MNAGQEREDPHIAAFIGLLALYVAWLLAAWYFARQINLMAGSMAWLAAKPFDLLHQGLRWAGMPDGWFGNLLAREFLLKPTQVTTYLETHDYGQMTAGRKAYVNAVAGRCLSLIAVPILTMAAFAGRRLRPDEIYRTQHTLDSLIRHHAEHWSAARFARTVNPLNEAEITHEAIRKERERRSRALPEKPVTGSLLLPGIVTPQSMPIWARSLRPEEWLDAQGIDWSDEACEMDEVAEAFAGQLRYCWTGWSSLDIHHKALAAIFILFNVYRQKEAGQLMDDLAILYAERGIHVGMKKAIAEENGLLDRIEAVIASPDAELSVEGGPPLKQVADGHAWVETAMIGMLQTSRMDKGILASARFLWLKQCDRTLWYALNNLGGNTFMVECAGLIAHFRAEQQFGFPIATPYVRQAARALVIDYLDLDEKRVAIRKANKEKNRSIADRVRAEVRLASEATAAMQEASKGARRTASEAARDGNGRGA